MRRRTAVSLGRSRPPGSFTFEMREARLPSDEAMASRSEARLLCGAGDATGNGDRIPTRDRPAVEYPVRGV
jgi:hypothetical protein